MGSPRRTTKSFGTDSDMPGRRTHALQSRTHPRLWRVAYSSARTPPTDQRIHAGSVTQKLTRNFQINSRRQPSLAGAHLLDAASKPDKRFDIHSSANFATVITKSCRRSGAWGELHADHLVVSGRLVAAHGTNVGSACQLYDLLCCSRLRCIAGLKSREPFSGMWCQVIHVGILSCV